MYLVLQSDVIYPQHFCWTQMVESSYLEYADGFVPQHLFEFDAANLGVLRVRKFDYHIEDGYPGAGSGAKNKPLVYFEDGEDFYPLRPTVAAWVHLLICMIEKHVFSTIKITKRTGKEKLFARKEAEKLVAKKKAAANK